MSHERKPRVLWLGIEIRTSERAPEKVADRLERRVGGPTELRAQREAHVCSKLRETELTGRLGAVALR
jgi:hypothetical protein